MPAREAEQQKAEESVTPEVAPVETEAAANKFSQEGEVPAVAAAPAIATGVSASEQAFAGNKEETAAKLDKGMHVHADEYKATCEAVGKPEKWKDHYRLGHTEAKGWVQPYERYKVNLEWQLQHGASASKAIQDFVKGTTICDYRTAGVAHDMNTVREELGDKKFDKLFGSANSHEDQAIASSQRLMISAGLYTTPLVDNMRAIAKAYDDKEKSAKEEPKAAQQEARVEEKPKAEAEIEQEPLIVAQELGVQQAERA